MNLAVLFLCCCADFHVFLSVLFLCVFVWKFQWLFSEDPSSAGRSNAAGKSFTPNAVTLQRKYEFMVSFVVFFFSFKFTFSVQLTAKNEILWVANVDETWPALYLDLLKETMHGAKPFSSSSTIAFYSFSVVLFYS